MHELLTALPAVAVVVLVIVRRFTPRRFTGRRPFTLPLALGVIGLAQGVPVDRHHTGLGAALSAGEIVAALLLGAGLGATMHVWRDADGAPWCRGTWRTFGLFLLSIAVRGGLMAAGYAAGVKPGSGAVMLVVAVWLLAQNAVLSWRTRRLPVPARVSVYS